MTTADAPADTPENAASGSLPFESPEEWQEFFEKFGANGRTFQDFTNLTPESMEVIYLLAYNQYNGGKYDEAEKIFQLLSVLNHFDRRFWLGLGASREMQKKYDNAIKAYGYLAILDIYDPLPSFHCAKCFLALGRSEEAQAALTATVANAKGKPEHADLLVQAENLLEVLTQSTEAN